MMIPYRRDKSLPLMMWKIKRSMNRFPQPDFGVLVFDGPPTPPHSSLKVGSQYLFFSCVTVRSVLTSPQTTRFPAQNCSQRRVVLSILAGYAKEFA